MSPLVSIEHRREALDQAASFLAELCAGPQTRDFNIRDFDDQSLLTDLATWLAELPEQVGDHIAFVKPFNPATDLP